MYFYECFSYIEYSLFVLLNANNTFYNLYCDYWDLILARLYEVEHSKQIDFNLSLDAFEIKI